MWLYILCGILVVAGFGSLLLLDHTARKLREAERGVERLEWKLSFAESRLNSEREISAVMQRTSEMILGRLKEFADVDTNTIIRQAQIETTRLWMDLFHSKVFTANELVITNGMVVSNCIIIAPRPMVLRGTNASVIRNLFTDTPSNDDLNRVLKHESVTTWP